MDQVKIDNYVDNLVNKLEEYEHKDEIIFQVGDNDYRIANLEDFSKQGIDGILYDLNRLEDVLITLAKSSPNRIQFLVNDLSLVKFTRYLYSEYQKLKLQINPEVSHLGTNID